MLAGHKTEVSHPGDKMATRAITKSSFSQEMQILTLIVQNIAILNHNVKMQQ